jgi:predicted phosphoribosyltransferase
VQAYLERAGIASKDVVVLAVPRGGVEVGYEVARAIHAPLDVYITRKIGAPGNEELAIGAVASDGSVYLDHNLVDVLDVSAGYIEQEIERQRAEIDRRLRVYRPTGSSLDIRDRVVILVDDGVATGATTLAALRALRQGGPRQLILAVPVGPPEAIERLQAVADAVICLATPEPFWAVGRFFLDWHQTTDDEVLHLLAMANADRTTPGEGEP